MRCATRNLCTFSSQRAPSLVAFFSFELGTLDQANKHHGAMSDGQNEAETTFATWLSRALAAICNALESRSGLGPGLT